MALRDKDKDKKETFKDVFQINQEMLQKKQADEAKDQALKELAKNNINTDIGGNAKKDEEKKKEMDEFRKVTEEDIELASKLIFNGYAEKEYECEMVGVNVKMCTLSADEIILIDSMILDYTSNYETNKQMASLSEYEIYYLRSMLNISLSFVGIKKKSEQSFIDIEPGNPLNTLKEVIKAFSNLSMNGADYYSRRQQVKDIVFRRYLKLKSSYTVHFTNFLITCKSEFDKDMSAIMDKKAILPKS